MMIAIVGCGTLGSRLAELLADEDLLLIDHDLVAEENLTAQRYEPSEVGLPKAQALGSRLDQAFHVSFIDRNTLGLLSEAAVVCDCTDNLLTRKLLNRWCLANGVTLVHAAASTEKGVVAAFRKAPCLECVYERKVPVDNCRGSAIDPSVADAVARQQARLARDALREVVSPLFHVLDAQSHQIVELARSSCSACRGEAPVLSDTYITWCNRLGCYKAVFPDHEVPLPGARDADEALQQID